MRARAHIRKTGLWLCGLLLASAGCSGGGGGSISLEGLANEYEYTMCQILTECGGYPDIQTCLATNFYEIDANIPQLQAGADAGRLVYDGDKARQCIDAIAGAISNCDILGAFEEEDAAVCDEVFTGTVEIGGDCYIGEECAGDADCDLPCGSNECCVGTCVEVEPEPEPVGIGEDCSDAPCVDGAYCEYDSGTLTRTCVAEANEGEACTGYGSGSCADGLYCTGGIEGGVCVRPAAEGETCDPSLGFGVFSCARVDNWCDPEETTCKKRPVPGEECNIEVDNCIDYAYCGTDGTCVERPGEGDECGAGQQITCLGDLECAEGICTAPAPGPVCGEPAA
jgi:hypothetical protein